MVKRCRRGSTSGSATQGKMDSHSLWQIGNLEPVLVRGAGSVQEVGDLPSRIHDIGLPLLGGSRAAGPLRSLVLIVEGGPGIVTGTSPWVHRVATRRRMTRRFPRPLLCPITWSPGWSRLAQRAPSAGFTQGWDVVALTDAADRDLYWSVTTDPDRAPDAWRRGVGAAPALLLMLADPRRYLDRYAEPDKGGPTGHATGGQFPTGTPTPRWPPCSSCWGRRTVASVRCSSGSRRGATMPCAPLSTSPDRRIVGVIALGHEDRSSRSPSLARVGARSTTCSTWVASRRPARVAVGSVTAVCEDYEGRMPSAHPQVDRTSLARRTSRRPADHRRGADRRHRRVREIQTNAFLEALRQRHHSPGHLPTRDD